MTASPEQPAIRPGTAADLPQVLTLLAAAGLPEAGLASQVETLLVAEEGNSIVGSAAVEVYGEEGLLRSVTVAASHRGRGLGTRLTEAALAVAESRGVRRTFLLTTDADGYFAARGFVPLEREAAPPAIRTTEAFASACPTNARLLVRPVDRTACDGMAPPRATGAPVRFHPALPLVAVLAFIILLTTLSGVLVRGDRLSPDARQNLALTLHLRASGGFSLDGSSPSRLREPLPIAVSAAFMALFTDVPATISLDELATDWPLIAQVSRVNLLYEFALFLALWWLAWRLTRSHLVGALAILGTYTFLFQSWSNVRGLLTETPAALTVTLAAGAAVWLVQTGRLSAAVLTGVSLGAVALTKAAGLYVAVVAVVLLAAIPLLSRLAPRPAEPTSSPSRPPSPPPQSPRRALQILAVMALAFAVTVTPWMVRNYLHFDDFAIAERSGGVLLVRAVKNEMTADEYLGAFYAYSPSSVRKDIWEGLFGFQETDLEVGGRYERLSRFQPGDEEAVNAADPDRAVSFFGKAGALQAQIAQQAAAEGVPRSQVDQLVRERAMAMIREAPGKHLLMTLPFAWRGLWAFANDYRLIVALSALVAFLTFLAFPVLAVWRRRADWLAFSLFGVGLFWFYALLTHFISRYSEPLIPLTVLSVLVVVHDLARRIVRRRRAPVGPDARGRMDGPDPLDACA